MFGIMELPALEAAISVIEHMNDNQHDITFLTLEVYLAY